MAEHRPVTFNLVGWRDWDQQVHYGTPPDDTSQVYGVAVHVTPDNPNEPHERYWFYSLGGFETWDEWWLYIDTMLEMYGLSVE